MKLQTVRYDPSKPIFFNSEKCFVLFLLDFLFNFKSSNNQSVTISPHFSSYIIPFLPFTFSFGICSSSAYFLAVLQSILCIFEISLIDNDLSFLKYLLVLISGIVSFPFILYFTSSLNYYIR